MLAKATLSHTTTSWRSVTVSGVRLPPSGVCTRGSHGALDVIKTAALIVTALAAVFTAFIAALVLVPNLKPVTAQSFLITNVSTSRRVSLAEYLETRFLKRVDDAQTWRFPKALDSAAAKLGTVVDFQTQQQGFSHVSVGVRWTLFDADSGEIVGGSERLDPFCVFRRGRRVEPGSLCIGRAAVLPQRDISTFAFWIDTSGQRAGCFFVRIEAYSKFTRVAFKDSPTFPPAAARTRKCAREGAVYTADG